MKDTSATDGVTAGTTVPHYEENQQGVQEQAGTDNIDDLQKIDFEANNPLNSVVNSN